MKIFAFVCTLFILLAFVCNAQDLDTVTVSDQFDSGLRGNATGSLTYGAPALDGSEYLDISNTDGVTGTIRYINGFAGGSAGTGDATYGESPVEDCTVAHTNPDRALVATIPAIAANSRPGATSPANVLMLGDDGGWNGIFLGESDDSNYYVQVDVYCYDQSSWGTSVYENVMLCARAARDNDPNITDYSFNLDRAGSYCIMYDSVLQKVQALKWAYGQTYQSIQTRTAANYTEYAAVTSVAQGWHTFRIECYQTTIRYYLDGSLIASATDSDYTNGRPGFGYREYGLADADERQGHFDNLQAGPFVITTPTPTPTEAGFAAAGAEWSIYE
jgi:hypothetical protein